MAGRTRRTITAGGAQQGFHPLLAGVEWTMVKSVLGVIGGSGLYDLPGLEKLCWRELATPWGMPSDQLLFAELDGLPIRFLPRHGRGHKLPPSAINFRANIDALKRAGVTDLVSVSACGSLKEEYPPGHVVIVDQFIDRTRLRETSFFGPGCVAHVSIADPVSPLLADALEMAAKDCAVPCTRGGTYLVMEGPQFSTRAESNLYRSWGCDVIGMTNMPEAKLAREAEICYAVLAMVTDYDCWHSDHQEVDVAAVLEVLRANVDKAHALIGRLARDFPREHPPCPLGSDRALDVAIITPQEGRDPALLAKLDAVAGRVLARPAP
jgi:5'-methylthioadenosine phosphorylase